MNRRQSLKLAALSGAAFLPGCATAQRLTTESSAPVFPKPLRAGSTVRLIAPGGPVTTTKVQKAVDNLTGLGLKVQTGENILAQHGQNAGTDQQRLADYHAAFSDSEVEAVWAIRGGDGSTKLLPDIDFNLIRNNPKILIGFSDITALLQANFLQTGLVGYHGPIGYWALTDYNLASLRAALFTDQRPYTITTQPQTTTWQGGTTTGTLLGGNLSLVAALCGTPNGFDATDKIIFLEDVGEAPRRIDRLLTQLKQAANLDRAAGIILGEFLDCDCERDSTKPEQCVGNSLPLIDVLKDRLSGFTGPIVYNFPFGHDENLCTFPVGAVVKLDGDRQTITVNVE